MAKKNDMEKYIRQMQGVYKYMENSRFLKKRESYPEKSGYIRCGAVFFITDGFALHSWNFTNAFSPEEIDALEACLAIPKSRFTEKDKVLAVFENSTKDKLHPEQYDQDFDNFYDKCQRVAYENDKGAAGGAIVSEHMHVFRFYFGKAENPYEESDTPFTYLWGFILAPMTDILKGVKVWHCQTNNNCVRVVGDDPVYVFVGRALRGTGGYASVTDVQKHIVEENNDTAPSFGLFF